MITNIIVSAVLLIALHGAETDFRKNPPAGDNGTALGIYQIRPCVVKDVNAWYHTSYKHRDALDPDKASRICELYLKRWGMVYVHRTGKIPTDEVLSRIWNGGPEGWKHRSTFAYWHRRVLPYMQPVLASN